MTTLQFDKSLAKKKIRELDLDYIARRLVRVDGCTEAEAQGSVATYKNLLELLVEYPDRRLAPPTDGDRALHAHIIYTRRYAKDMNDIFGRFVHHDPDDAVDPERDEARAFTSGAFFSHFGVNVESFALCWVNVGDQDEKLAA